VLEFGQTWRAIGTPDERDARGAFELIETNLTCACFERNDIGRIARLEARIFGGT
jgi:hypothetical protein